MTSDLTTRRGFIVGVSLSLLSLYGLRVATDDDGGDHGTASAEGGHGGHGGATGAMTPEHFRHLAQQFIAANSLPDGSVQPQAPEGSAAHAEHAAPIDVYLMASRWLFEPAVLRIAAGRPYRFRMMAVDVGHGASIQLGRGSRMIRLPAGVLNEQLLTFASPGAHLLYCTTFCGPGHDSMSARILVG